MTDAKAQRSDGPNIFPQWMDRWRGDPRVDELLCEARDALALRGATRASTTTARRSDGNGPLFVAAARRWSGGEPPSAERREHVATIIWEWVDGELSHGIWTRFLLLESALADAMQTSDQLFAASLLRTIIEEISWLQALGLDAGQVRRALGSGTQVELERVQTFMTAVHVAAGPLQEEAILKGTGFPKPPINLLPDRARKAKLALNGFVHPNYGSHVAALYPESREAALILLEAIAATYEALPGIWPSRPAPAPLPISGDLLVRENLVDHFEGTQLGDCLTAATASWPANPIDPTQLMRAFRRPQLIDDLTDPLLAELVAELPRHPGPGIGAGSVRTWACAGPNDVLSFALARRAEQRLRSAHPAGMPERAAEREWLSFNIASLELVHATAHLKRCILLTQLIRQISRGNPLGIILCARALIENHAVSLWLPGVIDTALGSMTTGTGTDPSTAANGITTALAQVLATNARSNGIGQAWAIDPRDGRPRARINLGKVVELVYPEGDFWSKQYDFGSAVIHGRALRSLGLSRDMEDGERSAKAIGMLVLAKLVDEEMDVLSAMAIQGERLQHAARSTLGQGVRSRWSWGFQGTLAAGLDYTGAGSPDDPIVFKEHVHPAVGSSQIARQLLGSQIAVEAGEWSGPSRILSTARNGSLCDVWQQDGREAWVSVLGLSAMEAGGD
jgi:hypothetical protein